MFTGIVECLGTVINVESKQSNLILTVKSEIANELSIDQSVSHNGVCLTVIEANPQWHKVTAVHETLIKSNLGKLRIGDHVNLERAMVFGGRLDGHLVQGHVDGLATCTMKKDMNGSSLFTFNFPKENAHLLVNKGSVTINGVSLTVIEPTDNQFSVAIIPYTMEHTTFGKIHEGSIVNLEYDIMGKYFERMMSVHRS
ncbi:UNVERIFIED_CONTAM: hypothetical protein GTU68_015059 [Idotea baltica]|nr:hypothetical protein [Idotea baltica]